jgi:hypothetical protein
LHIIGIISDRLRYFYTQNSLYGTHPRSKFVRGISWVMDIFPEEKGEKLMIMKVRLSYRTWPVVREHLYPGPGRGDVNLNRFQKDKPRRHSATGRIGK